MRVSTSINMDSKMDNSEMGKTVVQFCSNRWRAVLTEVLSTSLLLLFGCMGNAKFADNVDPPPMYGAFSFGFMVLFNVQAFGHISGAHMNPAVTLAAVLWGSMSIPLGILYVLAQCVGATLGYGILTGLLYDYTGVCLTRPRELLSSEQALGIEIVLTSALVFLCCGLWDPVNKDKQENVSIKFGLVVAGLSIVGGELTGTSMNPARTLGPAIWNNDFYLHWVYWVGPLVGSILASLTYKFVLMTPQMRRELKSELK